MPPHSNKEEKRLLSLLDPEGFILRKTGLVIGRFQPIHYGHLYLAKQALRFSKKIIIGIGSANVIDKDNPYSAEQREYLLRRALRREKLDKYVEKIVYINDYKKESGEYDDDMWIKEALRKARGIDIVFGNNDWVNRIFGQKPGIKVQTVPELDRKKYQSTVIRADLRKSGILNDGY